MATERQKKAAVKVVENGGNVSKAMRESGYTDATSKTPQKLTESKAWRELMKEHLPDANLAKKHAEMLNSTRIDHMVFPLGPKGEDEPNLSGAAPELEDDGSEEGDHLAPERTTLTDIEITEMLAEVNCKMRRIVHGDTARHVYYWAADNKARKDALEMAYKLKGSFAADKHEHKVVESSLTDDDREKLDMLISEKEEPIPIEPPPEEIANPPQPEAPLPEPPKAPEHESHSEDLNTDSPTS